MIIGVDVSSHRIDLAWLEHGKPCRWHQELAKGHLIDRLRSIHVHWPKDADPWMEDEHGVLIRGLFDPVQSDVTDVAIEMPFGQSRSSVGALMAVVGVVTKQAPRWARVAWPSSGELRAAINAKNTKTDAKRAIFLIGLANAWNDLPHYNEHELDALVACIGWTRILESQDACTP